MEILDQLQSKVRNAVQKIEELQNRVTELEEVKKQYEDKMASLVSEIGDLDAITTEEPTQESDADAETETATEAVSVSEPEQSEAQPQESLYRHQF